MPYARRGNSDERNYANKRGELAVIMSGEPAGVLSVYQGGFSRFDYVRTYGGPALSARMPRGSGPFLDACVRPWCEGLLPDSDSVRRSMGQRAGVSPHDAFGLLGFFGRDCPGAVQVCDPDDVAGARAEGGAYEPVGDAEIARRLLRAKDVESPDWWGEGERWSLGGAQGKLALARIDGAWHRCLSGAASTHIIKPGVPGFELQQLDEYLCMRLASSVGLACAQVSYQEFAAVPAIVVERYDREIVEGGLVARLHQEDLCQAMGLMPKDKYKPSAMDCMDVMRMDGSGDSVERFVSALFFNYLIGATDAHAKNYSCMHLVGDDLFLAPLYDLASIFPYVRRQRGARSAAMAIGRERRLGRLCGSHVRRFASQCDLDPEGCLAIMERLAYKTRACVEEVVRESAHIRGVEVMGPELVRTVQASCTAMLANLDRDGRTCDTSLISVMNSGTVLRP